MLKKIVCCIIILLYFLSFSILKAQVVVNAIGDDIRIPYRHLNDYTFKRTSNNDSKLYLKLVLQVEKKDSSKIDEILGFFYKDSVFQLISSELLVFDEKVQQQQQQQQQSDFFKVKGNRISQIENQALKSNKDQLNLILIIILIIQVIILLKGYNFFKIKMLSNKIFNRKKVFSTELPDKEVEISSENDKDGIVNVYLKTSNLLKESIEEIQKKIDEVIVKCGVKSFDDISQSKHVMSSKETNEGVNGKLNNKVKLYLQKYIKERGENKYYFLDKKVKGTPYKCLYTLTLDEGNPDTGSLEFLDNDFVLKSINDSPSHVISGAAVETNRRFTNCSSIKTITPGKVTKKGDIWVISKKAEISYE